MNIFNEDELRDLTYRVCLASVKKAFPHIPLASIIDPPHREPDAVVARQIAMHLMVGRFGMAKKRAGRLVGRASCAINRAIETVDRRLDEPEFEAQYRIIADRAEAMFNDKLREAA
ncbi:hypothetical protein [Hoeflea sp.]|uniref:hypothetical protein n=1 Tax=Hoeflea sp. TaxID=1940281 RepID=UPI003A8F190D